MNDDDDVGVADLAQNLIKYYKRKTLKIKSNDKLHKFTFTLQ